MIVSGGENVYPIEVEELLSHHPDVADVAVVGVPDDEFGQVLAAFVVSRPGATADAEALRAHVRDHLARHKVPRRVTFLDELPRNPTGKVLRRVLVDAVGGRP
jgi:fatty-acyl-CoA synthase